MTVEEYEKIVSKYEKTDKEYYNLLIRVKLFCSENYRPIIKQAESENKQIYLKTDSQTEASVLGIHTDGTIYLEDIGIK
jgi:hypothetical protein